MADGKLKIPQEWRLAAEEIFSQGGPVVVVGAPGSGKSTFCMYLTGLFCRERRRVAWIDADPGQPYSGTPAVISLSLYSEPTDLLKEKIPGTMIFIGNTSPVGHFLEIATGLQKLLARAQTFRPDLILINTCGLVSGGAARELKFHEIDIVSPRYVVALQKDHDVEHLLTPHAHRAGLLIYRIPLSPDAKHSTREARLAVREQRFKDYFRGAGFQDITVSDVGVHGPGLGNGERLGFRDVNRLSKIIQGIVVHAELSSDMLFLLVEGEYAGEELYTAKELYGVKEIAIFKQSEMDHLLVGLNDANNLCLGLGILRGLDIRDMVCRVITPVRNIEQVRYLAFGSLRVSPAGSELGRW